MQDGLYNISINIKGIVIGAYGVALVASLTAGWHLGSLLETGLVLFVVRRLIRGAWQRLKGSRQFTVYGLQLVQLAVYCQL